MNFYTLTYDADLPAVQQVNVPTNTDYKVGIKVKRNGEIQSLSPDNVTLGGLSADADKTNGYVTFTLSSDDSASYTNQKIDIENGYAVNAEEYNISSNNTGANLTATLLSVDLSQYAGTEVFAKDMQIAFTNISQTVLTKNDLLSTLVPYWEVPGDPLKYPQYGQYAMKPIVAKANGDKIYSIRRDATFDMYINGLGWDINKPAFLYQPAGDGVLPEFRESITIDEGDVLQMPLVLIRKDRTAGVMFKFTSGTPFSAKFDLNTNIFKSQQGDINIAAPAASTVAVEGTYADGTEFSFDFMTK